MLDWTVQPGRSAVTSTVTLAELLVLPYRNDDQAGVDACVGLLVGYPNLEWIPLSLEVAKLAAEARAKYRLEMPDAIHAATAIHAGATAFVTNDPAFRRLDAFETLVLDELL
ncbi:MAG: type II toxin-antitoxin system VapC family toxin [Bryobacteraceae bacterium]|nr:type II toxin-antitoxin system VapC family toxin [Bryobacteraceae bacterium]